MKIIIFGGSGFIGSKLSKELVRRGHSVVSVDLNPPQTSGIGFVQCQIGQSIPKHPLIRDTDAVINLTGRSIVGPWNKEHKDSMRTSRINSTQNIVALFKDKEFRPKVFVQASAVGVYGNRGEEIISEGSSLVQNTFLATLASEWEKEAFLASRYNVRTCVLRQATVLGKGGFMAMLRPLYSLGLGGPIGQGQNWFPWIHEDDLIRIYIQLIENPSAQGIYNAVAGEVVRYKDFSKHYASILHKPHFLHIPLFLFRLKYHDFTNEITASQKIITLRTWELGNCVKYQTLLDALNSIEHHHGKTN